ncbi:MAG: PrsW family intramembrane metalloprotease [Candidatus Taylorbacteria bacterium]|nr:PrsW family intramembrane metalloprotease [Candidatus Taylorbacteria bacterium]
MADLTPTGYLAIYALLGGILPALFWLWFWVQEDKLHPEPRGRILFAFWGGMLAVPFVYPLEKFVAGHFGMTGTTLVLWALIEEVAKYGAAWATALRTKAYDEPIDALEYLITAALGFAALENALFILNPLIDGDAAGSLVAGNLRFIGASLLHVVSSGVLGYFIGREFYRSFGWKVAGRIVGLALAVGLHALFNVFIIYENGSKTFLVFACVWVAALGILLLFERIKKITAKE